MVIPIAFVLINTEVGGIEEVLESLNRFEEVVEAYGVYGVYDIVAKVQSNSMSSLKETVTGRIRQLKRVKSTLTMVKMEAD
jgi:DNA-binding Lrp family transcriptional regulator